MESLKEKLELEQSISSSRKGELDDSRVLNETLAIEKSVLKDELERMRMESESDRKMVEKLKTEFNEKTEKVCALINFKRILICRWPVNLIRL